MDLPDEQKLKLLEALSTAGTGDIATRPYVFATKKFIQHPILDSTALASIKRWKLKYERYLLDVSNNPGQIPRPQVECLETIVLEEIAEVENDCALNEVDEQMVWRWITLKLNGRKRLTVKEASQLLEKEWYMDVKLPWHDRTSDYYKRYKNALKEHHLEKFFESREMKKKRIEWLKRGVRPKRLRDLVRKEHCDIAESQDKASIPVFFKLLEKMNNIAAYFLGNDQKENNRGDKRNAENETRRKNTKRPKFEHRSYVDRNGLKEYKCFVEGCQEQHRIKEHPNITKTQKDAAYPQTCYTEPSLQKVTERFYWKEMRGTVDQIVVDCILCRIGKGVTPTRIHLGHHDRPTRPNMHVHFDHCSEDRLKHGILVIRDGFSRFVFLVYVSSKNAEESAKTLMKWIAIFGIPAVFFSDNASHFRNDVMFELARLLAIRHDFSTVYCAWSNGLI